MNRKSSCSISDDLVRLTSKAYSLLKTKEEIIRHITVCRKNIKLVEKAIDNKIHLEKGGENPVKLESNLASLKYYLAKLNQSKRELIKTGSGGGVDNSNTQHQQQRKRSLVWHSVDSCFDGRLLTGIIANLNIKDPRAFLNKAFKSFKLKITSMLKKSMLKVNVVLLAHFIKPHTQEIEPKHFVTKNHVIDYGTDLKMWYKENVLQKLLIQLEEFAGKDSGWALQEILHLKVNINNYEPLKGGSSTYVKVPYYIAKKHATINVKNNDEFCFLWAIVSALYPCQQNSHRIASYPHFQSILKYKSLSFPFKLCDISTFENMNNLAINLYCLKRRSVLPFCLSKNLNSFKEPINLLVLSTEYDYDDDADYGNNTINNDTIYHFVWIKDLSRLVTKQLSSHGHKKFLCHRCLNHFSTDSLLQKHIVRCKNVNTGLVTMPDESNNCVEFKNFSYQENVPFVIYADLESILEKCENPNERYCNTSTYQKHTPFSVAYYLKCSYDDALSKFRLYRGKDCICWFVNQLQQIAAWAHNIFESIVPMNLSNEQMMNFSKSTHCHICNKPFTDGQTKVRDHSHLTGEFRGAAHLNCNVLYKDSHMIPVVFHNLSGYDSHFIIRELATAFPGSVKLLPINKEKYISFTKIVQHTKISFRFIDSFRFMSSSIEKLSSYLENCKKSVTRKHCNSDEEFVLLIRKGVFPYDYIDSWDKLDETVLPPQTSFYSILNDEDVTDECYSHAIRVWRTFNIKSLGEYSDLYLKTDVLLLTDIFENFRKTCLATYQLDALHYFTAPGLAFDAMLKSTKVRLELFTDIDMAMFVEQGIRGGVAQCSNRYAKANNRYMGNQYNPLLPTSYLMYFDINNLYGAAMSQCLPYAEFVFMEGADYKNLDILNHPDDAEFGYIFDCNLEYPKHLHESHSDLPLAPEHRIPPASYSKFQMKKLMLTFYPKKNYIIHYRNLKLYLKYGMQLVTVNKILRFKQSPWLKTYIDLNTSMRQMSRNDFDKNFYKLMINSVFGKLMENVRKYKDVKLVTKWGGRFGARTYIAKPNFNSCTIFDKDMVIIEMDRLEVVLNKPIYAGFTILDISKTFLYDFHYEYIVNRFGDKAKLLYTDTDSLIYAFSNTDIYQCMREDSHRFDTSDYPINNVFGIKLQNKKVPGLMKDENNGEIMLEFVGLRAKMYAYRVLDHVIKKSKGATRASIKSISFNDYTKTLFNNTIIKRCQKLIRSKHQNVFTIKQSKVVLNPYDDKRMVNFEKTDTLPWGYKQ